MKNSILDIYEELLQQSLKVPKLVTLAAKKDAGFLVALNSWLMETEELLKKNRIAECAEIAALRSKILSARYNSEIAVNKKRKHILSIATGVISDAQNTLLSVLTPMKQRIDEARDSIRQLLGVAYQANMIDKSLDFNSLVQELWQIFSTHEQLKGLTSKILVYVNKSDALRILAEEIELNAD